MGQEGKEIIYKEIIHFSQLIAECSCGTSLEIDVEEDINKHYENENETITCPKCKKEWKLGINIVKYIDIIDKPPYHARRKVKTSEGNLIIKAQTTNFDKAVEWVKEHNAFVAKVSEESGKFILLKEFEELASKSWKL